ncbi:hypothetical protein BJ508DRAFT_309530, partial [Ascobolus immersus RN42]
NNNRGQLPQAGVSTRPGNRRPPAVRQAEPDEPVRPARPAAGFDNHASYADRQGRLPQSMPFLNLVRRVENEQSNRMPWDNSNFQFTSHFNGPDAPSSPVARHVLQSVVSSSSRKRQRSPSPKLPHDARSSNLQSYPRNTNSRRQDVGRSEPQRQPQKRVYNQLAPSQRLEAYEDPTSVTKHRHANASLSSHTSTDRQDNGIRSTGTLYDSMGVDRDSRVYGDPSSKYPYHRPAVDDNLHASPIQEPSSGPHNSHSPDTNGSADEQRYDYDMPDYRDDWLNDPWNPTPITRSFMRRHISSNRHGQGRDETIDDQDDYMMSGAIPTGDYNGREGTIFFSDEEQEASAYVKPHHDHDHGYEADTDYDPKSGGSDLDEYEQDAYGNGHTAGNGQESYIYSPNHPQASGYNSETSSMLNANYEQQFQQQAKLRERGHDYSYDGEEEENYGHGGHRNDDGAYGKSGPVHHDQTQRNSSSSSSTHSSVDRRQREYDTYGRQYDDQAGQQDHERYHDDQQGHGHRDHEDFNESDLDDVDEFDHDQDKVHTGPRSRYEGTYSSDRENVDRDYNRHHEQAPAQGPRENVNHVVSMNQYRGRRPFDNESSSQHDSSSIGRGRLQVYTQPPRVPIEHNGPAFQHQQRQHHEYTSTAGRNMHGARQLALQPAPVPGRGLLSKTRPEPRDTSPAWTPNDSRISNSSTSTKSKF